jgi:hypothetical protein
MFFVHFADGSTQTEQELQKWDNVQRDMRIKSIGLFVPVNNNGQQHLLMLSPLPEHCDKYCCTKLGRMLPGKDNGNHIGYALMGIKNGLLYRIEMTSKGFGPMQILPATMLKIRESAWRDGC